MRKGADELTSLWYIASPPLDKAAKDAWPEMQDSLLHIGALWRINPLAFLHPAFLIKKKDPTKFCLIVDLR